MPVETAATDWVSGSLSSLPSDITRRSASSSATYPPVIAAQRVPPSASSTSQSIQTVRSPSASKSTIPRSERPIRRWISTVRPSGRPLETSRRFRSPVEAGSIEYSAVTQPRPFPAIQRGTSSSTLAVQITRVPPASIRHDPVAVPMKPGVIAIGRRSPGARPSLRASPVTPPSSPSSAGSDLADRQLEEARAEAAELLRVARGEEPVAAAPLLVARHPRLAQASVHLRRRSPHPT